MRKKNIILAAILAIATIIAIAVWVGGSNLNQLKDMDSADIAEIIICNPAKYYTITEQEDMQTLLESLQSMNLSRKLKNNKDGFAFLIDIKLKSGETIKMSILSGNIRINNHYYKPDKDYCNSIGEIFNTLSEKYENNPT